jgi:hypothetical protein
MCLKFVHISRRIAGGLTALEYCPSETDRIRAAFAGRRRLIRRWLADCFQTDRTQFIRKQELSSEGDQ